VLVSLPLTAPKWDLPRCARRNYIASPGFRVGTSREGGVRKEGKEKKGEERKWKRGDGKEGGI